MTTATSTSGLNTGSLVRHKEPFQLTKIQVEAQNLLRGPQKHTLLVGGSRSGKSFLLLRAVIIRAAKAPGSRHAAIRFRANAIKSSLLNDTFLKVMRLCFPAMQYVLNKTEMVVTLANGSEIHFIGCDDQHRMEKVLGMEFVTLFFNESSQVPFSAYQLLLTRLAQRVDQELPDGTTPLSARVYVDLNPVSDLHWCYKLFIQRINPETRLPLSNPEDYQSMTLNPVDNVVNLGSEYLDTLASLSEKARRRFLDGQWASAVQGALFEQDWLDRWRSDDGTYPEMQRIAIGVDPSGAADAKSLNDAIGIVVAGLALDGNVYVLQDCTVKAGPAVWGRVVAQAYDRWQADVVIGEKNYGGAMVKHVIRSAMPTINYTEVTASRGKHLRAEPFSELFKEGKIRFVERFDDLEQELTSFTNKGYVGEHSPDRADALIHVLSHLLPRVLSFTTQIPEDKPEFTETGYFQNVGFVG